MNDHFGHHQLHNRYRFTGHIKLLTGLRLSSGRASDETDAPLMRDGNNRPFIPGSSLRGALRSELERILAGVGKAQSGVASCILFTDSSCEEKYRQFIQEQAKQHVDVDDQQITEFAKNELCDLCRLFGSSFYASKLVIEDAVRQVDSKIRVRDSVGIDRDTGAASEGVKFDYEVLEISDANAILFDLNLQVENLTEKDKNILKLVEQLLRQALYVGGKRAGGLGKIALEGAFSINGFINPSELWERLKKGGELHNELEGWNEVMPC